MFMCNGSSNDPLINQWPNVLEVHSSGQMVLLQEWEPEWVVLLGWKLLGIYFFTIDDPTLELIVTWH